MALRDKANPLEYDNVFKAGGRWAYYAELEEVVVPAGGLNIGSLLKENGGKYEHTAGDPTSVLAVDVENETAANVTAMLPVCKSGTVLGLGVTYAGGDDFNKVKKSLENNHIDIIKGEELNNG